MTNEQERYLNDLAREHNLASFFSEDFDGIKMTLMGSKESFERFLQSNTCEGVEFTLIEWDHTHRRDFCDKDSQ
tara:strand:+ start:154 stop:375 length:222 start_codon:yes stop_codon:yes gene_type:complete